MNTLEYHTSVRAHVGWRALYLSQHAPSARADLPSDKGRLGNRNLESRADLSGQGWLESEGFESSSPRAFISVPNAVQSPARIASIARL
jgi:hypothetical protein